MAPIVVILSPWENLAPPPFWVLSLEIWGSPSPVISLSLAVLTWSAPFPL